MTKRQERKVQEIKEGWVQLCGGLKYADKYEIKRWEVDESEYFVSVVLEVGMKNDEGTLAQVFAREHVHLFVFKGGRVEYPVTIKKKDGTYKHYQKRLGTWLNLFGVYYDQNCRK